jgi:hypothetical protein
MASVVAEEVVEGEGVDEAEAAVEEVEAMLPVRPMISRRRSRGSGRRQTKEVGRTITVAISGRGRWLEEACRRSVVLL